MRTFVCVEIDHAHKNKMRLHKIDAPDLGEPKGYTTVLAFEAFRNGKRKGVSKADLKFHRSTCAWAPSCLYSLQAEEDWLEKEHASVGTALANEWGVNTLRLYEGGDTAASPEEVPFTHHTSLKDFFTHIGFDHKKRRYVDANGKPIKYSVVKPQNQ